MAVADRSFGSRNVVLIIVMCAFEFQEFVVAAFAGVGVLPADMRAGMVNRALARLTIQKGAHGFVNMILVVSQDLLVAVFSPISVGIATFRQSL
jgi:hypothetical protein